MLTYAKIFTAFCNWLSLQENYSKNTVSSYSRTVKNFLIYATSLNKFRFRDIDRGFLLKFASVRVDQKPYAPASLVLRLAALNLFYEWAKEQRYCPVNTIIDHRKAKLNNYVLPKRKKQLTPNTKILSQEQQQQLLEIEPKDNFVATRDKCIIALILATGINAEEILSL